MSGFDAALTAEAAELLYREAYHLDRREWEAWLALYTDDAVFWAPAIAGEEGFSEDPDNDVSPDLSRPRRAGGAGFPDRRPGIPLPTCRCPTPRTW